MADLKLSDQELYTYFAMQIAALFLQKINEVKKSCSLTPQLLAFLKSIDPLLKHLARSFSEANFTGLEKTFTEVYQAFLKFNAAASGRDEYRNHLCVYATTGQFFKNFSELLQLNALYRDWDNLYQIGLNNTVLNMFGNTFGRAFVKVKDASGRNKQQAFAAFSVLNFDDMCIRLHRAKQMVSKLELDSVERQKVSDFFLPYVELLEVGAKLAKERDEKASSVSAPPLPPSFLKQKA